VGFLATPGSKTPELIATKLGVRNYVRDPTLTFIYGSDGDAWGVSAHAWNITVCDFPFFNFLFSFLHVAYRSPRLTDFHDLYVKQRVFAQGCAFWGSRWWFFTFTPLCPQKFENLHYGLMPMATSDGNNSCIFKDRIKMFAPKWGFSGSSNLTASSKFALDWPLLPRQPTDDFQTQNWLILS